MKKIIGIFIFASLLSCGKNKNKFEKLKEMNWLIGNWENKLPIGTLTENWKKENDSTFLGQSYFIKAKDTLHNESIELKQVDENVFYIPTVMGQNNDEPVSFKLTLSNEKQLVFENSKHDYPQKIVYSKITNDSIVATISGIQQGKSSQESYPMKKIK